MLYLGMDETGHAIPSVNKETQVFTDYYGSAIPVEPWAKFIAVDADGKVHCYDEKPAFYEAEKQWLINFDGWLVRYCGEVDLEGVDWRNTLRKIKEYRAEE